MIIILANGNSVEYAFSPECKHPIGFELKGCANPGDPKRGNKRQRGGSGLGDQCCHWHDASLHPPQLKGEQVSSSYNQNDLNPQVAPEPLVLLNSCVMIVANLAVCTTISIYRFCSSSFYHSNLRATGGESQRLPDLRFHPGAHLILVKGMSSAISMDAMRLPMMMVMNIATAASIKTMTQTVILKRVSPARVQIAKTMILNQLLVTRVKSTCQDKKQNTWINVFYHPCCLCSIMYKKS